MSNLARAVRGAAISGGVTALSIGIVLTPILAVVAGVPDASTNAPIIAHTGWLLLSLLGTLVAALVGCIPGALIGAWRADMVKGAIIGELWGFIAGGLLLGAPFNLGGAERIFVGLAVSLPGAALGVGVAWQLSRK